MKNIHEHNDSYFRFISSLIFRLTCQVSTFMCVFNVGGWFQSLYSKNINAIIKNICNNSDSHTFFRGWMIGFGFWRKPGFGSFWVTKVEKGTLLQTKAPMKINVNLKMCEPDKRPLITHTIFVNIFIGWLDRLLLLSLHLHIRFELSIGEDV